jgi:flagellin
VAVSSLGQFSTYSNQMNQLDRLQATSAERLTTGLRINSSADDAAGLAISSGMESVVRAASLVQDFMDEGEAMLNATEGVLASLESLSQRMRELTLQSMSGSLGDADRTLLQLELQSLSQGFNQMAMGFEYNAQPLLSEASKLTIPSGPYLGDELTVSFESFANDIVGSHHFKVDAAGGFQRRH